MSTQPPPFHDQIKEFNEMYRLPAPGHPTLTTIGNPINRLEAFKNILAEELEEVEEILGYIKALHQRNREDDPELYAEMELTALTSIGDWLGDIQVYAASEMTKFGLPQTQILEAIMSSNFSKRGADGNPIYDERGKVQKGPDYFKPEPRIRALIKAALPQ